MASKLVIVDETSQKMHMCRESITKLGRDNKYWCGEHQGNTIHYFSFAHSNLFWLKQSHQLALFRFWWQVQTFWSNTQNLGPPKGQAPRGEKSVNCTNSSWQVLLKLTWPLYNYSCYLIMCLKNHFGKLIMCQVHTITLMLPKI